MIDKETLDRVADQYCKDGYAVTCPPVAADLPAVLADAGIDFVARKDREAIAVLVRRREDLLGLDPAHGSPDPAPGWHLDLVVLSTNGEYPPANGSSGTTADRAEWTAEAATTGS